MNTLAPTKSVCAKQTVRFILTVINKKFAREPDGPPAGPAASPTLHTTVDSHRRVCLFNAVQGSILLK